jgi:DNA-binding CsgD family transcriptional regulator
VTPDAETVDRLIGQFIQAAIDPAGWMPAMAALSDALGAVTCTLELTDLATGAAHIENVVPLDDDVRRAYEERVFHINPRIARAVAMPEGHIADDRTLLRAGDPHLDEFLDWLGRAPYHYIIGGKILNRGSHAGFLTASFSKQQGLASDDHRAVFTRMTPHLVNAVAVGRALSANRLRNDLVALDALGSERAFALLDRAGRVAECSSGFARVLRTGRVLGVRRSRLVGIAPQHRSLVERFVASAIRAGITDAPPAPVRLASIDAPRGLILRALPLTAMADAFAIFHPVALITVTDLDQPVRASRHDLMVLFDLTPREADVAASVGEGNAIAKVAASLAISEHTVRQHLKAVFGKLGITRQAELAGMIARLG